MDTQNTWDGTYLHLKSFVKENKIRFFKLYTKQMKDQRTFGFTPLDLSKYGNPNQILRGKWAAKAIIHMGFADPIENPRIFLKCLKLMLKWHTRWWKWYATKDDGHKTGVYMPEYSRTLAIQEFIHRGFVHKIDAKIDMKAIHIYSYLADLVYPMNFDCQADALKLLDSIGLQGITGVYLPKTK